MSHAAYPFGGIHHIGVSRWVQLSHSCSPDSLRAAMAAYRTRYDGHRAEPLRQRSAIRARIRRRDKALRHAHITSGMFAARSYLIAERILFSI